MGKHTKHMLGLTDADRGDLTTSKCAALGVFYSIKAALSQVYGSADFAGRSVAIKGVGKLGGELARLVSEAGGQVVIADIDDDACKNIQKQIKNVKIVSTDSISAEKVDVYAPCALGKEFNNQNIDRLRCKIIAGGANNQLGTEEAGDIISERGILYAPDYIANAGGLIYVADELEPDGFKVSRVKERIAKIEKTMNEIFSDADKSKRPTHRIADELAQDRINKARHV